MRSSRLSSSSLLLTAASPVLVAGALLAAFTSGCSGSNAPSTSTGTEVAATVTRDLTPSASSASESALVSGNTDFALNLYRGLTTSGGATAQGNLFYSPYSVSLALAMTYAGAKGATASQIATALSFTLDETALNPAFDKLDLAIQAKPTGAQGDDGAPFAITVADSLWGDDKVNFGQSFVNTLALDFGASLRRVDFLTDAPAAEASINAWVANETNDKIDPLLGPGAVDASTALVIVNAVYFNAAWATQFNKAQTTTGAFTRADGTSVQTKLMASAQAATTYAKGSNYQAVELPYSGSTTSMVVILPDAGAYAAVEQELTGSFYETVTGALSGGYEISLTLPSFTIHGGSVSLKPELEGLGMIDAFASDADLTGMIPAGGSYIADVIHQAFVEVDESGTEAAAATAVTVTTGAVYDGKEVSVDVNRSFFFFIRDNATNTVLFVGREDDPTTK